MKIVTWWLRTALVVLPLALVGAGCDIGDLTFDCRDGDCGPMVTRSFDLAGFDAIHVADAFRVTVRQAAAFRVEVSVPKRREDDLEIRRDGSWLRIAGRSSSGVLSRVTVDLPILRRLEAEDASQNTLRDISSSGRVELVLSGASQVEGDLAAEAILVRLATASQAELEGSTERLELDLSEVSRARLRGLASRRADAELRTASTATISVSQRLDVTASSVSVLRYVGDPELGRVDLSGGAQLERER
jgi:hypothetical protein